jgi:hypothetical protein
MPMMQQIKMLHLRVVTAASTATAAHAALQKPKDCSTARL